jgi:hypothetical protein
MKRLMAAVAAFLCLLFLGAPLGEAQDQAGPAMKIRPVAQTPEWQKLTSLAGEWEGSMEEGGAKQPTQVEVRVTGGGSAVMHVMGKGGPYEMVTMFHPDGSRLLATHYCAAHNQPRMAMVKAPAPNQLAFEFVDGTNIEPGDLHMRRLLITFTDADHHTEVWTAQANGKDQPPAVFTYTRKK